MRSQRKSDESVFEDWASVHGRLLPWSEDQTTTHYESAQLRYLQRQPRSNEPSYWQLDETLELIDDDDDQDNPFARARTRTNAWLWSSAAGSGLIAAVLFGRVLLYGGSDAHAAPAPPAPEASTTQQPSAASPLPSVDSTPRAVEVPQPQSAIEVSRPAARTERHSSTSYTHTRIEPLTHAEHEHVERAPSVERASPANAAPGTLRLNSRPWSQVFIDDRLIGTTPQLDISLPAGAHTVRLTNPEFGMTKVFSVRVPAGETISRVETLEE